MVRKPKNILIPLFALAAVILFAGLSCKLFTQAISRSSTPTPESQSDTPPEASVLPKAVYLGQDGGDYAGKLCSKGSEKDNIHIRLSRLRKNELPNQYRVEDGKGGVWINPCDPAGNDWLLFAQSNTPGEVDLYFKPNGPAPKGTRYLILIRYPDEVVLPVVVESTEAIP